MDHRVALTRAERRRGLMRAYLVGELSITSLRLAVALAGALRPALESELMHLTSPSLRDRLDMLYEERASLKAQLAEQGRAAAAGLPGTTPNQLTGRLLAAVNQHQFTTEEIAWVERQILAILANPALGQAAGP